MIEPTKRLWGVLDYGLAGLSQEESENANKIIVQAIEDINTLKAKAELLDALTKMLNSVKFGEDVMLAFGGEDDRPMELNSLLTTIKELL